MRRGRTNLKIIISAMLINIERKKKRPTCGSSPSHRRWMLSLSPVGNLPEGAMTAVVVVAVHVVWLVVVRRVEDEVAWCMLNHC